MFGKEDKKISYISSILIIINGFICIIFREKVMQILPILCGSILLIRGIIKFIQGFKNKDYASLESDNMEKSLIPIAIGLGVLIKRSDALFIVGMFWGIHGLIKSSGYLNVSLHNLINEDKWILLLIKAIVEFSLSLALIFDPFGKIGHHIIILGLELIFDGSMELISNNE